MQCCSKLPCSVSTRHPGQFDNSIPTSLSPGYGLSHQLILGAGAGGIFELHCILERWKGPHNNMINNIFMWISFSTIQSSEAFSVSYSYILCHSHMWPWDMKYIKWRIIQIIKYYIHWERKANKYFFVSGCIINDFCAGLLLKSQNTYLVWKQF